MISRSWRGDIEDNFDYTVGVNHGMIQESDSPPSPLSQHHQNNIKGILPPLSQHHQNNLGRVETYLFIVYPISPPFQNMFNQK